jgi:LIM domain-binding protein 1
LVLFLFHCETYLCPEKISPISIAIGRTLIPRYFRSIFEGGATELYYVLKHPKEAFHSNFVSLDCDQGSMVTQHGKPMFTQVSKPAG